MKDRLRIAIIASSRYPICEPFAGGLEAHVWSLARVLRQHGHQVTLFAQAGSDATLGVELLQVRSLRLSAAAREDVSMPAGAWIEDHHAYLDLMLGLGRQPSIFDVVHNHSLHYLPIAMAKVVPMPFVTTLHTPPTPWMESAVELAAPGSVIFTAVSRHTAEAWAHIVPRPNVILNGIDTDRWSEGPGGSSLIWFGRITPEKGTHLAAAAAHSAGEALDIAGPIADEDYFNSKVRPLLGGPVRYVGHLGHSELSRRVGHAKATLVTPCWDEPFGLVVAESLSCGTPVCGFAAGALPEVTDEYCARLVPAGDVHALAHAIAGTAKLSRVAARQRALESCSLGQMVQRYEDLYYEVVEDHPT